MNFSWASSGMKITLSLFLVINLTACSSVTIRQDGGDKDTSEPTYMDSKPFYFFGLKGEHEVDVNEVCDGADVSQMQTVMTSSDYVIGMLTLFFYSPRTAKVWCEDE